MSVLSNIPSYTPFHLTHPCTLHILSPYISTHFTHPFTHLLQDEDLIDEALGLKKKRRVDMGNDLDALDIKALLSRGGTERASEVCQLSSSISYPLLLHPCDQYRSSYLTPH